MTDKEKAIRWFENIADECDKLTSGNVAHLRAQIKGMAIRSAEYLKRSQEPASEDLAQAAEKYAIAEYHHKNLETLPDRCWGCYEPIVKGFKSGAQWDREQMMKDAVIIEDELVMCYNNGEPTGLSPYKEWWDTPEVQSRFKDGDKIKVIIIKE